MSTAATLSRSDGSGDVRAGLPFAVAALTVAAGSAFLAGWLPLGFSIVTVFLFAGPHNWLEVRYFLGRLPARWGRLRDFFLLAFAGIFGLTASFAALPWLAESLEWDAQTWFHASALWSTGLVLWIATLVHLRSRQNPRRDWFLVWPVAFVLVALAWLDPYLWGLGLVYAHPLVAFWVLDRELRRSRPAWRPAYHLCLTCLPLLLGILWYRLAQSPNLPGQDALSFRITRHAGAGLLTGVSSHLLVATHTFLEMLHYGIWVVAIPLVTFRSRPWDLHSVPLARRSPVWRRAVLGLLCVGGAVVLLLWSCFLADYPLTRDVYFTVALLHVLAEVPFLLRAL
jgi:hypothetical protein